MPLNLHMKGCTLNLSISAMATAYLLVQYIYGIMAIPRLLISIMLVHGLPITGKCQAPFSRTIIGAEYGTDLRATAGGLGTQPISLRVGTVHFNTNVVGQHYCGMSVSMLQFQTTTGDTIVPMLGLQYSYKWALSERSSLIWRTSIERSTAAILRDMLSMSYHQQYYLCARPMLCIYPLQHYGRLAIALGVQFTAPLTAQAKKHIWLNYGVLGILYDIGRISRY
jgi:hypothetical protein